MYFFNCFVLQGLILHLSLLTVKLLQCTVKLRLFGGWFLIAELLMAGVLKIMCHGKDGFLSMVSDAVWPLGMAESLVLEASLMYEDRKQGRPQSLGPRLLRPQGPRAFQAHGCQETTPSGTHSSTAGLDTANCLEGNENFNHSLEVKSIQSAGPGTWLLPTSKH